MPPPLVNGAAPVPAPRRTVNPTSDDPRPSPFANVTALPTLLASMVARARHLDRFAEEVDVLEIRARRDEHRIAVQRRRTADRVLNARVRIGLRAAPGRRAVDVDVPSGLRGRESGRRNEREKRSE